MLKLKKLSVFAIILITLGSGPAFAHFGMVIPTDSMVMQQDPRTLRITFSFSHPMELIGMDLVKPKTVTVFANGRHTDLISRLNPVKVMGHPAWELDFPVKRPGIYIFYMEPQPYWEPAEDAYIIHHTKTVVTAFGDDEGWDTELGVKTEIVPLSRPFGLYAGNLFQGIVKLDGKPVPHSTVEIEFYNQNAKAKAPTDTMITQTVKADGSGIFSYAVPAPGWWGFAALNPSNEKIKLKGKDKDVELGAVLWVKFHPWLK
jgi:cobalt/nickel transport protein